MFKLKDIAGIHKTIAVMYANSAEKEGLRDILGQT